MNTAFDQPQERVAPQQRVSRREPCALCGSATYCLRFDDGSVFCKDVGEPWQWTDHFLGGYLHHDQVHSQRLGAPQRTAAPPSIAAAPPEIQHAVYADLLAWCPLTDAHRTLLTGPGHGLTDEEAARYGSLRSDASGQRALLHRLIDTHGTGALLGTPGFYLTEQGRVSFVVDAGILMPRRDGQGRITGVQVRTDNPGANARYVWASSARYDGPSCGASAHITRPVTLDPRQAHKVGVVEGIKKADVLANRLGYPFIGIAGVGTVAAAETALEEMAAHDPALTTCLIAFDRDTKPRAIAAVERARQRLARFATKRGLYAVRIAVWSPDVAKGPDDLVIAGHTFTEQRYQPADDDGAGPEDEGPDTSGPRGDGGGDEPGGALSEPWVVSWLLARLADCWAQVKAWEHLFTNPVLPHKAKMVLVHMHKRAGQVVGARLPDALPCDQYAEEQDVRAHGLGMSAYKEGRDILLSLGLVARKQIAKKIPPPRPGNDDGNARPRGKDWYYAWGLNGPAINDLWGRLPALTEIAPTEQQVQAIESRKERLARAIEEEKPTWPVVRALKREVAEVRQDREKVVYEYRAATYERDNARAQAEIAARERDQALHDAQRIIRDNQRPPTTTTSVDRFMCRAGCGSFIMATDWCCDECRERERDAWMEASSDLELDVNSKSDAPSVVGTNQVTSNHKWPPAASSTEVDTFKKPCYGGCGTLTDHGYTCKACREGPSRQAVESPRRWNGLHGGYVHD